MISGGMPGQVGGKGPRPNQLDGLEAARQQNLERIQNLQQTLEAAHQQEAQVLWLGSPDRRLLIKWLLIESTIFFFIKLQNYSTYSFFLFQFKSQMDIMAHLHVAQQQEQQYKQLEVRTLKPPPPAICSNLYGMQDASVAPFCLERIKNVWWPIKKFCYACF